MEARSRVLLMDDKPEIISELASFLERAGYMVAVAKVAIWQFSTLPAVPLYWRWTPTDRSPFFRNPVSSTKPQTSEVSKTSEV